VRILDSWVNETGLDPSAYGTRSMRRTKADLPAHEGPAGGALLLEHTKLKGTVRCLGIAVDDALESAEQTEI
jgi:hypothetical protein